MATTAILQIEDAITQLNADELMELYRWLDENRPMPIDIELANALKAGKFDSAIESALADEANGLLLPL